MTEHPATGGAPGGVPDPEPRWRLEDDARRLAAAVRVAVTVLAVPAVMVALGLALASVVLLVLAIVALVDGGTVLRWVLLGLAVAGLAVAVVFASRVVLTRHAARDPDALAADLVGLVDISAVTTAVVADLAEVTSREGGVRVASRARALWRLLRRLDIGEHVESFERARWFVPPEVGTTWLLAQVATWGGLVAWALVPVTAVGRVTGWL